MTSKNIQDLKARYNANGNAIIPNTFQHPNIFVDRLMAYLSPVENIVLTFAVRRILGFQDNIMSRKDNISVSQFTDGIMTEDGRHLSKGCGVGNDAVLRALDSLALYKILIPSTAKPDPRRGQEYWLQDNEKAIDWDGLERRAQERLEKAQSRTQKARYSVRQKGSVGQNAEGSVGQNDSVLLDRNTKPTETHRKEEEEGKRKNIFVVYEAEIGPLTPSIADKLVEAEAVHTEHWVCEALKIASGNGKRNWNYADSILMRWKAEGYGSEYKPKGNGKPKSAAPTAPAEDNFMAELKAKHEKARALKKAEAEV